jgi:hypothetical protein
MSRGGYQFGSDDGGGLDAYLDGLLSGPDRQAFEARLAQSPQLRAEADAQRRLDGSLRSLFVVPVPAPLPPVHVNGKPPPGPGAGGAAGGGAAAAAAGAAGVAGLAGKGPLLLALLLALLGGALGWWYMAGGRFWSRTKPDLSLENAYRQLQSDGFAPETQVNGESELARVIVERLQSRIPLRRLNLRPAPPGVQWLGIAPHCGLPFGGAIVMSKVDGRDVLLMVGPSYGNGTQSVPSWSKLHLFRKEVGPLVVWEVTPLKQPRLLDLVTLPDAQSPATQPALSARRG